MDAPTDPLGTSSHPKWAHPDYQNAGQFRMGYSNNRVAHSAEPHYVDLASTVVAEEALLKREFASIVILFDCLFFHPLKCFNLFSLFLLLIVATQIWGHKVGFSTFSPTTVRASHFHRDKTSALSSLLVDLH